MTKKKIFPVSSLFQLQRVGYFYEFFQAAQCPPTFDRPPRSSNTLLPASAAWANLFYNFPIVTRTHIACISVADARYNQESRNVHEYELQDGMVARHLVAEHTHEYQRVFARHLASTNF
ncbi:metallothionein-I gene transcription activator [Histoplasma capsulatum var. duboisii H88]|uniref:Metallothionein-I gene transcription activator n=1 Tax=Ajellomyces capsulatus (strain H88) TaxID=544711 RepID=A0A8A1L5R5_AJEC8|nr:metallothionein-I gene transcription activator [Histoplasma capsulatum var. duboisii H88]